jgi:hypothetical protein
MRNDMSPEKYMETLTESLEGLGYVHVVKTEVGKTQIRLLCRVTHKKEWCEVVERLLQGRKEWTEHICQQYFLKDGAMVYGWNVIINATDIAAAATEISKLLRAPAHVEVDSFPLRGAWRPTTGSFNVKSPGLARGGPSQKGAHPVGGKG